MKENILELLDNLKVTINEKNSAIYLFTMMHDNAKKHYSRKNEDSCDQYLLYRGSDYMLQSTLDDRGFDIVIKTSKGGRHELGTSEFRELIKLFL